MIGLKYPSHPQPPFQDQFLNGQIQVRPLAWYNSYPMIRHGVSTSNSKSTLYYQSWALHPQRLGFSLLLMAKAASILLHKVRLKSRLNEWLINRLNKRIIRTQLSLSPGNLHSKVDSRLNKYLMHRIQNHWAFQYCSITLLERFPKQVSSSLIAQR